MIIKSLHSRLLVLALACTLSPAVHAQFGPPGGPGGGLGPGPGAPKFSAAFSKLFGEHKAFTADMNMETSGAPGGGTFSSACKLAFLEGKSRVEMDLSQTKGGPTGSPQQMQQFKAMGLAEMAMISNPAKGLTCLVYPGLQSYAEMPAAEGKVDETQLKIEITELGKETLEGHPCVKHKVVVTDTNGKQHESTVWNATDLKKFPVRIETGEGNAKARMNLTNVKFDKPDAKLFDPPANFTRYENVQTMMQQALMKRMLGGPRPGQ